ncbi:MAG TPA: cache domain-containing protein [Candidatus Nitrosotenuis sp.]|nr:cache domain-containing protein [Candidatus Nitrosotenuis sp.]
MKLRYRLLALTGFLLLATLGGSFAWIFGRVRAALVARVDEELAVSRATFATSQERSFETLTVLARLLETDPGLRTVLRRTDRATQLDYMLGVLDSTGMELLVLTDGQGRVRVSTTPTGDLTGQPGLPEALAGEAGHGYWPLPSGVYQVSVVPFLGPEERVEGALAAGMRLSDGLARQLARDTRCQVTFVARGRPVASSLPAPQAARVAALEGGGRRLEEVTFEGAPYRVLTVPLGGEVGLILQQDLRQATGFLDQSRWGLLVLALVALGTAGLVGIPVVERMTSPVELLEKARAELQAVFDSNLDGLVALDARGRVVLANPAAAAALGRELEELPGVSLGELLPARVADELLEEAPGQVLPVGRALLVRQGHTFRLLHSHVRRRAGAEAGSILVIRQMTGELEAGRSRAALLEGLSQELVGADSGRLKLLAANLSWLARLEEGRLELHEERVDLTELPGLTVEEPPPPPVLADPAALEQVLANLARGARRMVARRDGGAARLEIEGRPPLAGLELYLCQTLVEAQRGRLRLEGERIEVFFPAGAPPCP